jgi:uncharacterized lipoprotein YmbA
MKTLALIIIALVLAACTGQNPRDAHYRQYLCPPVNLQPGGGCGLSAK